MSFLFFFFVPLAGGASGGRLGEGESGGRLGRAKAAEDSDKAEVKVGEGCGEGPRGPPENDSSWAFGGLGEERKWEEEEEAKMWDLFAFMSWRMGRWLDYEKR